MSPKHSPQPESLHLWQQASELNMEDFFFYKKKQKLQDFFRISPFSIGNTSTPSGSSHFSASYVSLPECNLDFIPTNLYLTSSRSRNWWEVGLLLVVSPRFFWGEFRTFPERQRNISVTIVVVMILCFRDGTCLISTSTFWKTFQVFVDFCSNQVWSWYLSDWNVSFGAVNGYPFFVSPSTCTSAVEKTCHVLTVETLSEKLKREIWRKSTELESCLLPWTQWYKMHPF